MNLLFAEDGLTSHARNLRAGLLIALAVVALALRAINPETLSWLPFRTSCGAVTGLPCIFCGTTRALHHLLNGHWGEALYFNWLAFPVALIAALFAMKLVAEITAARQIFLSLPALRLTPRLVTLGFVGITALWLLQVSIAVSLHKHELLNSSGVLYRLVVK